nr:doublecortin domain-containing protein 2 [Nothobranchius furzeri]
MLRTSRRMDQPPTKTVTVYRNGDAFYPGRKVVVNPHQVTTFDNFLTNLTKKIEAPFGAVRRLYTPTQGHKVQHLEELKHGHAYVAAGYEVFKTLNYLGITNMKPQNRTIKQILPVAHSRIVASSRWKKVTDGVCTIKSVSQHKLNNVLCPSEGLSLISWILCELFLSVFTNGELLIPAARIRIPKHTLKSWENVLSMVTEKVALRTGAVFRLCRLDGRPVSGPGELENHQHYVAVGAEKFKPLPYEQWVPHRDLAKENNTTEGQYNERKKPQKDAATLSPSPSLGRTVTSEGHGTISRSHCALQPIHLPPVQTEVISAALMRLHTPKYVMQKERLNDLSLSTAVFPVVRLRIRSQPPPSSAPSSPLSQITHELRLRNRPAYRCDCATSPFDLLPSVEIQKNNNRHCLCIKEKQTSEEAALLFPRCHVSELANTTARSVFFKKDLKLTARGQMKEHTANMETVEQRRQVSKIPALFSAGESSVFNAQSKRNETAGATEVQDDRQVQVDLPIDQVEAKTVEEEHVDVEDVGDMNASQDDSDAESLQQSSYEGSQNT